MRILLLIIFVLINFSSKAQNGKNGDSLISIVYNSSFQTGNFQLTVDKRKVTYEETSNIDRQGEITKRFVGKMSSSKWENIKYFTSKINLDSLNKLVSPTTHRHADGAGYTKLTIKTLNTNYETQDFDSGNPMKEIYPLLSIIDGFINVRLINCKYK